MGDRPYTVGDAMKEVGDALGVDPAILLRIINEAHKAHPGDKEAYTRRVADALMPAAFRRMTEHARSESANLQDEGPVLPDDEENGE